MIRHKIKAFTLVELIVVITILAVLGTIAFVSFQGYAQSSRDSARITDLKSIQKVLALYKIESGFFPDADNAEAVTYLTSPIWSQGTFGENSRAAVKRISDIPVDPLTGTEYAYSTTYSKNEFEVGATFEGEGYAKNNITSLAMAGDRIGTSYVNGEYNGQLIQKEIGGILYVLAVPTIINANMDLSTLTDIVTSGTFAINGGHNLADSYSGTTFNTLGGGNITSVNLANMVVFSGSTTDLTGGDTTGRTTLLTNLQAAYTGTPSIQANPSSVGAMMNVNLGDSDAVNNYASSLVNNSLGGDISIVSAGPITSSIGAITADYCGGDGSSAWNYPTGYHNAPTSRSRGAFNGIKADGSIVVWGANSNGGDQDDVPAGTDFTRIYSTKRAFAALRTDGSIAVWGTLSDGGAPSTTPANVNYTNAPLTSETGFVKIYSNQVAFLALKADGNFVVWGDNDKGGSDHDSAADSNTIRAPDIIVNPDSVVSHDYAFAALKSDGTIVAWGRDNRGADPVDVPSGSYVKLFATEQAFTALNSAGKVISWGYGQANDSSGVPTGPVFTNITTNESVFAALDTGGFIHTWGNSAYGGGSGATAATSGLTNPPLGGGYVSIQSSGAAFAALHSDGSIYAWGSNTAGGANSTTPSHSSYSSAPSTGVFTKIFANAHGFTALKNDGTLSTWGNINYAPTAPVGIYNKVYSNDRVFAAIKADGSLVSWGDNASGGATPPSGTGFISVASSLYAFTALKSDGTVETWGNASYGAVTPDAYTGSIIRVSNFGECP